MDFTKFSTDFYFSISPKPEYHTLHLVLVSLVFTNLQQLLSLPLVLVILTVLWCNNQILCRLSLKLGSSVVYLLIRLAWWVLWESPTQVKCLITLGYLTATRNVNLNHLVKVKSACFSNVKLLFPPLSYSICWTWVTKSSSHRMGMGIKFYLLKWGGIYCMYICSLVRKNI